MAELKTAPREDGLMGLFTLKQHARAKGMWAGALTRTTIPDLQGLGTIQGPEGDPVLAAQPIPRDHTPAVLKCFDEYIVNASDHCIACRNRSRNDQVTYIDVGFDKAGRFTIENNGPGIPVRIHPKASKEADREVYNPEVAFGWFLGGTNLDREKDSVKGGINGVGAKLGNVHSHEFTVQTVDGAEGLYYAQTFRNRLEVIDPPVVIDLRARSRNQTSKITAAHRKPHTRVGCSLAYDTLGYTLPLAEQDHRDISDWLHLRCCQLAAYVGNKCRVRYNGTVCPTVTAEQLARVMIAGHDDGTAMLFSTTLRPKTEPYKRYPWEVAVALVPAMKKFGHTSILSGVVTSKGPHLTYLKRLVKTAVQTKVRTLTKDRAKETSTQESCKRLYLVVVGPLPGADWGGQRKDELQVKEAKLHPYTPSSAILGKIGAAVADHLLATQVDGRRKRGPRIKAEKYTPARCAGPKGKPAYLLAAEGDSAITLLRAGLKLGKHNPGGPSFEQYGIISLQGVIMNAMRNVTEHRTTGGRTTLTRSEKIKANKVLTALVEVLGLKYTCQYETAEERQRLNYSSLIVCTDQDLDGTGKILPLVVVFIFTFWPALIGAGFVKCFRTPVIRVYDRRAQASRKKTPVAEFYYENEYEEWARSRGAEQSAHAVKYYKGLATHDTGEVLRMFQAFSRSVHVFTEAEARGLQMGTLLKDYYGPDSAPRKAALSTPVVWPTAEEARAMQSSQQIPVSMQLQVDAKAYKLEAIRRQIPSAVDGLKPAARKILTGAIRLARSAKKERKVFQLGGSVAEHEFYHHGDASLNGTIIHMAQRYPGARQYPLLTGIGQFGSRHKGGADAGSARYISVKLTERLVTALFPPADRWLLDYVFEDGERAEPVHYVPTLPLSVLETGHFPSEAWNHDSYSRDFGAVVGVVSRMVQGEAPGLLRLADQIHRDLHGLRRAGSEEKVQTRSALTDETWQAVREAEEKNHLPVSTRGFCGEIRPYRGEDYSFGDYAYWKDTNSIQVTELPMGTATCKFIERLEAPTVRKNTNPLHDLIEPEVQDYSSDQNVDLTIRLRDGAWDVLLERYGSSEIDPVEDAFKLRESLRPHLNYVRKDMAVAEFGDSYLAALLYWFPMRRDLYRARLDRSVQLLELRIQYEQEILRYIGLSQKLQVTKIASEEEAQAVLARQMPPFARFNHTLLGSPGFVATDELQVLVLNGPEAKYDYILNLRERDLLKSAVEKRQKRLENYQGALRETLEHLQDRPFAGARLWLQEIGAVQEAVARGIETDWLY